MIKFIQKLKDKIFKVERSRFVGGPNDFEITDDPDYDIDTSLTLTAKEKKEIREEEENNPQ